MALRCLLRAMVVVPRARRQEPSSARPPSAAQRQGLRPGGHLCEQEGGGALSNGCCEGHVTFGDRFLSAENCAACSAEFTAFVGPVALLCP